MSSGTGLAADPLLQALCPLTFRMRRGSGQIVGRKAELAAIESEMAAATDGLAAVALEGEPGIGKTRLLVAAGELAESRGLVAIAVAADEELSGPFLLMRSVLSAGPVAELVSGTRSEDVVRRAFEALSGHGDPGLDSMPADQKLLRQYDMAAMALRELAALRPLALLVDDVQWADSDSLRALRYATRTIATSPVFLLMAMRPEESARVTEAITLVADLERMGLIRRLRPGRLSQLETVAFLKQELGGTVDVPSAGAIHIQSEGVPFVLEELVRAYRQAGMIQQIDGTWTLARNAEKLAPSAVQTLIQRRSGHLPEATKAVLAEAAVLGRSFSLKDLEAVRAELGEDGSDAQDLSATLAAAVEAGLLNELPPTAPGDYSFSHEQVRQYAMTSLRGPRRRALHGAVVQILSQGDSPAPASLPLLARHAAEAGDADRAARYSIEAARAAAESNAPEEVLRAVELALPVASDPRDRATLLSLRDDAMDMLRRPQERAESLAELVALADALGDAELEMDVSLRRAAALRQAEDFDAAADLARRVAERAREVGNDKSELAASLALGQALVRTELGEGHVPTASETDLDSAQDAFGRAAALAEKLGDDAALAAASRELGCIETGRLRSWFVNTVMAGEHIPIMTRAAAGEDLKQVIMSLPPADHYQAAQSHFERAIELFEKVGDRRGAMSSVIAMAYASYGADVHLGSNPAQRIEEIRRLSLRMRSLSKESERGLAIAQMAYGVHVFARAKVIPDLAITRGEEAYRAAQAIGDRALEFLSAGGTAMAVLDIGDTAGAEAWLAKAAQAVAAAPTPTRAWRLEVWRALLHSVRGDAAGMRAHFESALATATDLGRASARCEILARYALEAARLGGDQDDPELLELAERNAADAKELAALFAAHQLWSAQADAALAAVALARDEIEAAGSAASAAVATISAAHREDVYPEMLVPAARAILAADVPELKDQVQGTVQMLLALCLLRTEDESVRARWLAGPTGKPWATLAGPGLPAAPSTNGSEATTLSEEERSLLALLTEGMTTSEIAARTEASDEAVRLKLDEIFAKIGATSRGQATAFALAQGVL